MAASGLDLRAAQKWLCFVCQAELNGTKPENVACGNSDCAMVKALLVHCRALRAALETCIEAATDQGYELLPREKAAVVAARVVLGAAQDGEGPLP